LPAIFSERQSKVLASGKPSESPDLQADIVATKCEWDIKNQRLAWKGKVLLHEEAGENAQTKQCGCKSPGKLFNKIDRPGSPKHLIGTLAPKSTVHATSLRVLDKDHKHQEDANQRDKNGDNFQHTV